MTTYLIRHRLNNGKDSRYLSFRGSNPIWIGKYAPETLKFTKAEAERVLRWLRRRYGQCFNLELNILPAERRVC